MEKYGQSIVRGLLALIFILLFVVSCSICHLCSFLKTGLVILRPEFLEVRCDLM